MWIGGNFPFFFFTFLLLGRHTWGWHREMSAPAKFNIQELWGFYMKQPQKVKKIVFPLVQGVDSPPDGLLSVPRSGQSGPCGHFQALAGGRSIQGNPTGGFNFPAAPERKGSPEDLWAPLFFLQVYK